MRPRECALLALRRMTLLRHAARCGAGAVAGALNPAPLSATASLIRSPQEMLRGNVRANGLAESVEVVALDWAEPWTHTELPAPLFSLILFADCIYSVRVRPTARMTARRTTQKC